MEHQTWQACHDVIKLCSDESGGIFFFSLQAEKYENQILKLFLLFPITYHLYFIIMFAAARYGYRPIPKRLPNDNALQVRLASLSDKQREVFGQQYLLDENAVPAEYHLKSLMDVNDEVFWKEVKARLYSSPPFFPFPLPLLTGLLSHALLATRSSVRRHCQSSSKPSRDWSSSQASRWARA